MFAPNTGCTPETESCQRVPPCEIYRQTVSPVLAQRRDAPHGYGSACLVLEWSEGRDCTVCCLTFHRRASKTNRGMAAHHTWLSSTLFAEQRPKSGKNFLMAITTTLWQNRIISTTSTPSSQRMFWGGCVEATSSQQHLWYAGILEHVHGSLSPEFLE